MREGRRFKLLSITTVLRGCFPNMVLADASFNENPDNPSYTPPKENKPQVLGKLKLRWTSNEYKYNQRHARTNYIPVV